MKIIKITIKRVKTVRITKIIIPTKIKNRSFHKKMPIIRKRKRKL